MSIPIILEDLNDEEKEELAEILTIKEKPQQQFGKKPKFFMNPENLKIVEAFDVRKYKGKFNVFLPINYCYNKYGKEIFIKHEKNLKQVDFAGQLTELQQEVYKEAMRDLREQRSCIISMQCGLGKTILSLYIANKLKLKTMIFIHRIVLIKQWIESIEKVLPGLKIQVCDSSNAPEPEYDMYIMNMLNVGKIIPSQYENAGINTLIIDEAHICCAETMSKCLLYICPDYLIALTATPNRKDGLDKVLDVYFGENRIIRKIKRPHNVIKIQTNFEIEAKTNKQGKLDWNSVINSQSINDERNEFICDILQYYSDKTWIVLCKRVTHVKILRDKLQRRGENICTLVGNEQSYDPNARILVGTFSKCGVGFDKADLNAMMLASDIVDFEQIHGRVFRRVDNIPLFIDIVDSFKSLTNHWYERKKLYEEMGGTIYNYKIDVYKEKFLSQ